MLEIRMSIVLGLSMFIFRWLSLLKCSSSISFIKCHEYQAGNCSKKWFLKEIYIIMNRGNSYQVILTNADVCMVWHIGIPKETSFFFCISSVALPTNKVEQIKPQGEPNLWIWNCLMKCYKGIKINYRLPGALFSMVLLKIYENKKTFWCSSPKTLVFFSEHSGTD